MKGKLTNGAGSQYSHATSEHCVSSITTADAHTSAASSRLNRRPRRFKWTRPFRGKTKSGFFACAITFQTQSTPVTSDKKGLCRFQEVLSTSYKNQRQESGSSRDVGTCGIGSVANVLSVAARILLNGSSKQRLLLKILKK